MEGWCEEIIITLHFVYFHLTITRPRIWAVWGQGQLALTFKESLEGIAASMQGTKATDI